MQVMACVYGTAASQGLNRIKKTPKTIVNSAQ